MKPSEEPPIGAPSIRASVEGASLLVRPYAPVQLNGAASAGGGGGASALGVISTAPTAVESATAATLPNNSFFIASFLCRPGAPEPHSSAPDLSQELYIVCARGSSPASLGQDLLM